ncbi:MAG: cysteine peptidase family C39 domain-containing protein, partial [Microcystaceae cyanobacterium]
YLVCQGRVRLLSLDTDKQREVSTQLLTEGETFGADSLFCGEDVLPYRAVAASKAQVARISLEKLKPWLERLPELTEQWFASAQQRQRSLFFKTLTVLRSLSSQRLQQLLTYVVEKRVAAGEFLSQATPSEAGHFWLRSGQIENHPLEIGSSWGYPNATSKVWVAQTELWIYQLPKQDWEAASAIAPMLTTAFGTIPQSETTSVSPQNNQTVVGGISKFRPRSSSPSISSRPAPLPTPSESPTILPQPDFQAIEFPKPLKRRPGLWRNYPFIEQQSAADCGAACLAMISQYWGKRFSINSLRDLAGVGRSGASLKSLAKAAESLGYQARPVRASLSRLMEQKNPWIAHWQGDHYVVVYRIQKDRLLIADPAQGKRLLSRQDFLAGWTGYALLLDPTERLKEIPTENRSLSRFLSLLLPYRSLSGQIILVSLLIQVFGLVTPLFTQIILDQVVVNKSLTTLHVFALGILLFGVWGIGLTAIRQYLLSYLANRLDLTMLSGFISHTLLLPLKFFESRHVGDILTRVNENQKIQRFLISQVILAWLDFLMGFVYLGLMLYYNWRLTLLVVALIPPIVILTLAATPVLRQVSREVFNKSAEQNS